MLTVSYAECLYAECLYAVCRYAECSYAECRGANLLPRNDEKKSLITLTVGKLSFGRDGESVGGVPADARR
jgi:hypothetical protein